MPKDKESKDDSKDDKKKQEPSSEDNAFTAEDMGALESKETKIKTSLVDRIFKKKEKPIKKPAEEKNNTSDDDMSLPGTEIKILKRELKETASRFDNISMTVEKIEGKLENERAVATGIEERISRLTEEIGELRSMILDRERGYNEIETGYKKIESMAENIQPDIIKKDLDKKEREIIQLTVKIEQLDALFAETNKQIKHFREQMDKIRSLDNLLRVSKNIEDNISKISDTEKYTGRMAAKTEELFTEIDKRLSQFSGQCEKIESIDELTKELMISLDKNEVKLKEAVFKEDLEKLKSTVTSSVNEDMKKSTTKLHEDMKKLTETASEQKNNDKEFTGIRSDISGLKDSFKELKSKFELQNIDPTTNGMKTDQKSPEKIKGKSPEELPELMELISEKKISKLKKELEERDKKIESISSTLSNLKGNSIIQNNIIDELKRSQDALPADLDEKVAERTNDLKSEITQIANLLSIMQKNEHTSKKGINNLKIELDKKMKDISTTEKEENTKRQDIKKEIEKIKKEKEAGKIIKKEFNDKIKEIEKNIKNTEETITDLKDNTGYMKETIDALAQPKSKESTEYMIEKQTRDMKNKIRDLADIITIMQKNENTSKKDILNLKTGLDKKIKDISAIKTEEYTKRQHIKKDIEKIKKEKYAGKIIKKISNENTDISIHPKIETLLNPTTHIKETAEDQENSFKPGETKKNPMESKIKIETTYENTYLERNIDPIETYQDMNPSYDHDLRLNRLLRLIDKAEEQLKKNDIEDAKKTYEELISAYNSIHNKVPIPQIKEIYPQIEQLHNKIKDNIT